MDNQKQFVEFVTNASFNLTLSKNMIAVMELIAYGSTGSFIDGKDVPSLHQRGYADSYVPTANSLKRRGLVTHIKPPDQNPPFSHFPYQLTEAGRKVYELLVLAELVSEPKSQDEAA
jgi:hypothetical protein